MEYILLMTSKVITEMAKHTFPVCTFPSRKGTYIGTYLNLGACTYIPSLVDFKKLNGYLGKFTPDAPGQDTKPLPMDKDMNIIYHYISVTMKNRMCPMLR